MATYALQGPPHAGATITLTAPGGTVGDLAPTGAGCGLLIVNSATATPTAVFPVAPTYDGLAVGNRIVTIASAAAGVNGVTLVPLPDGVYGPGTTAVQYSTVTQLQVASVRIP